jgi:hypothetical protein
VVIARFNTSPSHVPQVLEDQYDLTQNLLPQSIQKLLVVLENMEKVVANSNAKERVKKEGTEKATGKREKGKRRGTSSKDYRIPKKVRSEKSCALCQKHGGMHTTHNTGECRKYEKDGTLNSLTAMDVDLRPLFFRAS